MQNTYGCLLGELYAINAHTKNNKSAGSRSRDRPEILVYTLIRIMPRDYLKHTVQSCQAKEL